MDTRVIAIEDNLSTIKSFLSEKGMRIIDVDEAEGQRVDAVVVSGMDENLLGIEDILIDAPVIRASGKTPEEIWEDIQRRLS